MAAKVSRKKVVQYVMGKVKWHKTDLTLYVQRISGTWTSLPRWFVFG